LPFFFSFFLPISHANPYYFEGFNHQLNGFKKQFVAKKEGANHNAGVPRRLKAWTKSKWAISSPA
jgi:hypothetical protein